MKSQLLYSLVLYSTLAACGADSGSGVAPVTLPTSVPAPVAKPTDEAKVEAKAESKVEAPIEAQKTATPAVEETAPAKALKLTDPDCVDPNLAEVKTGVQLMLCDGTIATGTLVIPAAPDLSNLTAGNVKSGVTIAGVTGNYAGASYSSCSANGEEGCVTNASFKAANLSNLSAANVKSGVTIAGITGSLAVESHVDCSANGQSGCVATSTYKAADIANLSAANVKSGVTIAGVSGSLVVESHSDCTSNGQTGCVTGETYKAADLTNLVAANLKNGVAVAGVTGTYPSASAPLASATATADLDAATFNLKIKSDAQFEYFDSTGARHTQTGNSALTAENIKSDVTLFNVSGTLEPASEITIDPWDLRFGKTVNGVSGKLKAHCRTHDSGTVPVGESCAQNEIWQDLTSLSSSTASTCAGDPSNCMWKDRISGLYVSKQMGSGNRNTAVNGCLNLVYGGFDDWRLPSSDEAITLSTHGAAENSVVAWYGSWTSSTYSMSYYIAIMGASVGALKTASDTANYFCVRK
jgi:hypothetical protein